MIWGVGFGVAALLAAVWAVSERSRRGQAVAQLSASVGRVSELESALAEALDRAGAQAAAAARMSAAAAQRDAALAQAKLSVREASAALVQREAALEEGRASAVEAERAHREVIDAIRAQLFSARRTLAAVSAERDRLAQDLDAAKGAVASVEAIIQERQTLTGRRGRACAGGAGHVRGLLPARRPARAAAAGRGRAGSDGGAAPGADGARPA